MIRFNIYLILKTLLFLILSIGLIFFEKLLWDYFILAIGTNQTEPYSALGIAMFTIINIIPLIVISAYIDYYHKEFLKNIHNFCKKERIIKYK